MVGGDPEIQPRELQLAASERCREVAACGSTELACSESRCGPVDRDGTRTLLTDPIEDRAGRSDPAGHRYADNRNRNIWADLHALS